MLICFISHLIYKRVRGYLVRVITVCTMPCYRNPSSYPACTFILVKLYSLGITFRTLFFNSYTPPIIIPAFTFYFVYTNICLTFKIYYYYKDGNCITNLLPLPSLLSAQILPLCFSMISLQINKPSPVPSLLRSSPVYA